MKRIIPATPCFAVLLWALAACQMQESAKTKTAEADTIVNTTEPMDSIGESSIVGDFDGDGRQEYVWPSFAADPEGYAVSAIAFESNKPQFAQSQVLPTGGMEVMLFNLGQLDDSGRDFVGAIYCSVSSWCAYYLFDYRDGCWMPSIQESPFTIWLGNSDVNRVRRDSSTPGNVIIYYNDMADVDSSIDGSMFVNHAKSVPLIK